MILRRMPDMECAGSHADGEEALAQIPLIQPQLVLMDIRLPGMSGIECARELKVRLPDLRIIMVTAFADRDTFWKSVDAGADGFVTKPVRLVEIESAVRAVLSGGHWISPEFRLKLGQGIRLWAPTTSGRGLLSARDIEIIRMSSEGLADKEIAERLSISQYTVNTHWKAIFAKLSVRSRIAAYATCQDPRFKWPKPGGLDGRPIA